MAVPSASTKPPSVAQVVEEVVAAALVVVVEVEATNLEAEEITVGEVDMVCVGAAYQHTPANLPRRRWWRLWT